MTRTLYSLAFLSIFLTAIVGCTKDVDENKVPVADAGASKSIALGDSTVVSGTGTDADGRVVAYLWSQVAGPGPSVIVNPGAASTPVKFNLTGDYIFQLMVTDDKGATGVDTMMVTVKPSPVKTLTLQPAKNPWEFSLVLYHGSDASGVTNISLEADAWTSSGGVFNIRGLVKFDLSSIPASATIKSANLYLYSNPTPSTGDQINANFGTANTMLVQQVTSNWTTGTATWFNQPTTATGNQIIVPHTNSSTLDLNLDVTSMVSSMVNSNANYGFMLKLQNEVTYNSRIFVASNNNAYPAKHPKLVIVYQ